MNFYVYIIQSQLDASFYKGFSANPLSRFQQHNKGEAAYTSSKVPWNPVALFDFNSKTEAIIFEKKIKKYDHKRICDFNECMKISQLHATNKKGDL